MAGSGRRAADAAAEDAAGHLSGLRRPTPESASRCTSCSADRRSPRSPICRCRISPPPCKSSNWSAASATLRATCWRSLPHAPRFLCDVGLGLSAIESRGADPLRRRGAAHSPGGAARVESARRVLRAGRAHHRPAPARQCRPSRHPGQAARQGQYAGRGRTRRRHHSPRRPCDRPGSRRGHSRRPRGGARNRRRTCRLGVIRDRPLSRGAAAAFALPPPQHRPRYARDRNRRRHPAQSSQSRRAHSARRD